MTKQEWKEKWENRPREDLFSTQADFFYSLHLQELSKIREMNRTLRIRRFAREHDDKGGEIQSDYSVGFREAQKQMDDILLAITDEK